MKYRHKTEGPQRGTFAIELPTKKDLTTLFLQHGTATLIKAGFTLTHPKDQFVRSEGRRVAENKATLVPAYLEKVEIQGTRHVYHFSSQIPHPFKKGITTEIQYCLSTITESDTVHFLNADWWIL